jgi:DNA-directed RNA polymerase beta subunit
MSLNTVNQRISFSSSKNTFDYPDFLEIQIKSFKEFFQLGSTPEIRKNEGLYQVLLKISLSPIRETILYSNLSIIISILHVIPSKSVSKGA